VAVVRYVRTVQLYVDAGMRQRASEKLRRAAVISSDLGIPPPPNLLDLTEQHQV
jgi:DNA-binding SARP family transcriptional activator